MNIEYGDGMLCCHLCGTDGVLVVNRFVLSGPNGKVYVRCRMCGTGGPSCDSQVEAKDAWNRTQKALAAADEGVVHELSVLRAKVVMFRDYLIADRNAADARVREQVQDLTSRLAADCLTLVLNRGLEMGLSPMRDLVPEAYSPYIKQYGFLEGMVGPICAKCGLRHPVPAPTSAVNHCGEARALEAEWQRRNRGFLEDWSPCRIFVKKGDDDGRT